MFGIGDRVYSILLLNFFFLEVLSDFTLKRELFHHLLPSHLVALLGFGKIPGERRVEDQQMSSNIYSYLRQHNAEDHALLYAVASNRALGGLQNQSGPCL